MFLFLFGFKSYTIAQNVFFSESFDFAPASRWQQKVVIGDYHLDTFKYQCPNYFPLPPINKQCAFFDVYNGGTKEGSNGNGKIELIELISPLTKVNFSKNAYLSFDYQFVRLRNIRFSLFITSDTGKTWNQVWVDTIGNAQTRGIDLRIDPLIKPNVAVQCKFQWHSLDTFLHQGYLFIDNISIYEKVVKDVAVINVNTAQNWCFGDSISADLQLVNKGSQLIDTIIVKSNLVKNSAVQVLTIDTFYQIKIDEHRKIKIPAFLPSGTGSYTLTSFVQSADQIISNDTVNIALMVHDSIKSPVVVDGMRCGAGEVLLNAFAQQSSTLLWFDKTQKFVGSGTWITPILSKTDTFQVKSALFQADSISTGQGPYRFNTSVTGGSYIQLSALKNIRINHLSQHFGSVNETIDALIYIRNGTYAGKENDTSSWLFYEKVQITTNGWGNFVTIPMSPLYLKEGDTLSMYISFTGKPGFTFKKGALTVEDPALSVYANGVNDKFFSMGGVFYPNYSWDGRINYESLCTSNAKSVIGVISPKPQNAKLSPAFGFSGKSKLGTLLSPDEVGIQYQVLYQVTPPKGKINSDYGSSWSITNIEIRNKAGQLVNSSINAQLKTAGNAPVKIVISGTSTWIDSILTLNITVKDNGINCDTVLYRTFRYSQTPGAAFSNGVTCINSPVLFKNLTSIIQNSSYKWLFEDGTSDTNKNTTHVFSKNKTYQVKLVAYNRFGASDTFSAPITIQLYPKSAIRAIHTCLGTPAELQNTSANASLTNSYYVWFYKGDTIYKSDDTKPFLYTFNAPGIHSVMLVGNNLGCIDTSTKNVFQFANPKGAFEFAGECQYDSFQIMNNSSISTSDKLGYRWTMDGQTFSTQQHPSGELSISGNRTIGLLVTSEFNCTDTVYKTLNFKPSVKGNFAVGLACKNDSTTFTNTSLNTSNLLPKYFWDFGDGNTSSTAQPKHYYMEVGEKNVQLRTVCDNGCQTLFDTMLVVRVHPNAHFEVGDVCAETEAIFLNKSKIENKILKYRWFFGDGDTSVFHSPKHVYKGNEAATYVVRLKVYTDDGLCTDEYSSTINVFENPECDFRYELQPDSLSYQFYALDSTLYDFTWTFSGGGTSDKKSPTHKFQDKKVYNVRLFAKNKYGCFCDREQEINVGVSSVYYPVHNEVKVYPNPFEKEVIFDLGNILVNDMQANDVLGKIIPIEWHFVSASQIKVNLANSNQNLIFITLFTSKGVSVIKLVRR